MASPENDSDHSQSIVKTLIQRKLSVKPEEPALFAIFYATGEGVFHKDRQGTEIEESSGFVITPNPLRVISYWVGWDNRRKLPKLVEWEEIDPEPAWEVDPEYKRAKAHIGI